MNRIINLQRKSRTAVKQKKEKQSFIFKCILNGLQMLRQAIMFDQGLQAKHKDKIEIINKILTMKQNIIRDITRMYIQLPLFIHSINLVRWYAIFRNKGKYNKDTYFTAMEQIRKITKKQEAQRKKGTANCPSFKEIQRVIDTIRKKDHQS